MADGASAPARIDANLSGAVISGQVAVGEHIVQIHAEHGAIVNYSAPAERPIPQPRSTPVRRLPRAFDALLGRERLLGELHRALADGGPAELVGEPGVGKTSLLRNVSHHLAELQPDGVVYTAVRGTPGSDVLQFLFETFYDCGGAIVVATNEELGRYLSDRRALIVLDDLELDRDELERVMDVVASSTFVCASALRRVWGEGRSLDVEGLDESAALALLERELGSPFTEQERPVGIQWCRALHGSPLRILQLGGVLRCGAPAARAALGSGDGGARAALARALASQLSESDRSVLAPLLAVPNTPVPTAAVTAASGVADAAERLAGLERDHIVQSHSPRYTMAGEPDPALISGPGLSADGERVDQARVTLARALARGDGPSAEDPQRRADAEANGEVLLALAREADTRHAAGEVLALAHAADTVLGLSGRWGAWEAVLDAALRAAPAYGSTAEEAWALHQIGSRALGLGDKAAALHHLQRALELREAIGDVAGAAVTRHNLDLLSGPPGGHGGPPHPRPRLPLIAAGVVVLALVAVIVVAVGLAGGHGGGARTTSSSSTTTSSSSTKSTTTKSTTTKSTTTKSTTTSSRTTTSSSSSSTTSPPPPVFRFTPDPPVVQLDLTTSGVVSGFGKVQVTNVSPSTVSDLKAAVLSAAPFGTDTGRCGVPLNPGDSCFVYMTFHGTTPPGTATLALTFTRGGAPSTQTALVTLCQSPPPPPSTPSTTSTTSTTSTSSSSSTTTTTYPLCG